MDPSHLYPSYVTHYPVVSAAPPPLGSQPIFYPTSSPHNASYAHPTYMNFSILDPLVLSKSRLDRKDEIAFLSEQSLMEEKDVLKQEKQRLKEELDKSRRRDCEKVKEVEGLQKKVKELDSYLREVPTKEEFIELFEKTQEYERLLSRNEEHLKILLTKYNTKKECLKSKDLYISNLESQNEQLQLQVKELKSGFTSVSESPSYLYKENQDLNTQNLKKALHISEKHLCKLRTEHVTVVTTLNAKLEQETQLKTICQDELEQKELIIDEYKKKLDKAAREKRMLEKKVNELAVYKQNIKMDQKDDPIKKLEIQVWSLKNVVTAINTWINGEVIDLRQLFNYEIIPDWGNKEETIEERLTLTDSEIDKIRRFILDLYAKECQDKLPKDCAIQ